ncbi:MAG: DUF3891 family protein [Opitutales bacterium]
MMRLETSDGWLLTTQPEHARVAAVFAEHWRNERFEAPEPFASVHAAVLHHDDSWAESDANPSLTDDGTPSAFSRELVGTYDAFENVHLDKYLKVRAAATEAIAGTDPYAAAVISMHSLNLLTEQADLSALDADNLTLHADWVTHQRARQAQLREQCRANPQMAPHASDAHFERAFRFLQACDNLSLCLCVELPTETTLRHRHPTREGTDVVLHYKPHGQMRFSVAPWPFDQPELCVPFTTRRITGRAFPSDAAYREAYFAAPETTVEAVLTPA